MKATGWTFEQVGELDLWQVRDISRCMQLDAKAQALAAEGYSDAIGGALAMMAEEWWGKPGEE